MTMSEDLSIHGEKPKKRQRMSVVCLNCRARKIKCDKKKPSCSNCVKCNVGHLCRYEAPHWVSRVTTSDGIPLTSAIEMKKDHDLINISPEFAPTVEELQDEIKRLRSMLDDKHGSMDSTYNTASNTPENPRHEVINLYEDFNGLTVKRSGMEERKPLSVSAHEIKDQYYAIMVGYFNMCSKFYKTRAAIDSEKNATKGNQKTRLDASLTEYLYMLNERQVPEVIQVVQRFVDERLSKSDDSTNEFFTAGFKNTEKKFDDTTLKAKIVSLLPNKAVLKLYLERFYNSIYPFYPYINREFFSERLLKSILQSRDDLSPITIKIEEKFDYVMLATLLIILRLTYVSLPKPQFRSQEDNALSGFPMNPESINVALSILSLFKFLRKTKLTIVQVLLYLRVYFIYAPEDGDGTDLSQSQILFGIIVQSAYTIALNRDPSNYIQLSHDIQYSNGWRKLWYGILEIDKCISTLSGFPCLIQNSHSYDTQIPKPVADDPPVEFVIAEELRKSQKILNCYSRLATMLNDPVSPPTLDQILENIREMKNCVSLLYSNQKLPRLQGDSEEVLRISFTNVKRLQHNLQSKSFILTVYQDLYLYFESKQPIDFKTTKHFQYLTLKAAIDLSNVVYTYFCEDIHQKIHTNHLYFLNRYVQNAAQRAFNSFASLLTRLYQAAYLVRNGDVELDTVEGLDALVSTSFRAACGLNLMIMNNLGTRYYQAFKAALKNKFYLRTLKKDGFKGVSDTISYFKHKFPGDPNTMMRILERIRLKKSPEAMLNELNAMNCFIHLSPTEVENFRSIFNDSSILNDGELSAEDLIWEPSFKGSPDVFVNDNTTQSQVNAVKTNILESQIPEVEVAALTAGPALDLNLMFADDAFMNSAFATMGDADDNNFDDLFRL